jgi:predicted  nucleic acid-binding Zn-ribbon protein
VINSNETPLVIAIKAANDLTKQAVADNVALSKEVAKLTTSLHVLRAEFSGGTKDLGRIETRIGDLEVTVKTAEKDQRALIETAVTEVKKTVEEAIKKLDEAAKTNVGQDERHKALVLQVDESKDNMKWAVRGVLASVVAALAAIVKASL